MNILYFKDHRHTGDDAYDLYRFITDRVKNDTRVIFEKDTYNLNFESCFERFLNISNHGWNGPKRIAALIEGLENVELDFSGSILDCHGVMIPFAIINSKNITVKNVILENGATQYLQTRVIAHGDGFVDLLKTHGKDEYQVRRGNELGIDARDRESFFYIYSYIEFNGESGEIERGTGDHTMGMYMGDGRIEDIGNDMIRVHGVKRYPPIGNIIVINAARRLGCGFFCEESSDILCENVTVHSCYGMGFLAQICNNITLRSFNTKRSRGRYFTANADATHFVNCTGLITVEDSYFEGQLDDALNIHGIYARIMRKDGKDLILKEMHDQAKGIKIFKAGDKIQVLDPESLIPYTEKTVDAVEYINADLIRLTLREGTDNINTGDDIESITRSADLIFRGNTVQNNRARGMLIATRGKTVIENNYFHTSGSAILFEADGAYWFESGGVKDVTVKNNIFDACKHGGWGSSVIECVPRRKTEEDKYFSDTIRVINNEFKMINDNVVSFNNLKHAVFRGNTVTAIEKDVHPRIIAHHVGQAEIETELPVIK